MDVNDPTKPFGLRIQRTQRDVEKFVGISTCPLASHDSLAVEASLCVMMWTQILWGIHSGGRIKLDANVASFFLRDLPFNTALFGIGNIDDPCICCKKK